ncbi:hypothetical protein [Flavobacterium sp. LHD-85]|uniref:hypothetical protein n=1 Tax=Flavobacterium sp. LHD-85 TaxID=3071410 RepID=UPI0027E069E0|nr:hypothetical protein [Flavobacterium sp. LHD-85]MDQ6528503.1 hypothetical protein [Flavobacterium sp. LHD-85]
MKKITIYLLLSLIIMSCKGQTLDLSTIDFDKPANSYPLEKLKIYRKENQKGHYEIKEDKDGVSLDLKDNGERVLNYIFMDESTSQINFKGLNIDPILGAKIVNYNNKIGYISANIISKETPELINSLMKTLGQPTEVIYNERLEETLELGASKILFKTLPQFTKKQQNNIGNNIIKYSQRIIWNKNDVIYQLTLEPLNNLVGNDIKIISKKAFKDRIIIGFHNPEKDPYLSKYLK